MKNIYVKTIGITLGLCSSASFAGSITDTFADGDTLTATHLNNSKTAVNDNDSRINLNITDINTIDARVTDVENAQTTQINLSQFGYAWANQASPTAEYTPSLIYSYNSSGQGITINKTATGKYVVSFVGLNGGGGTVTVTSYGAGNTNTCNVGSWGSTPWDINVGCYTSAGVAVDSRFTITVQSIN